MNVKRGDMAIVIKAANPENIGLVVSVDEYHWDDIDHHCWWVSVPRPVPVGMLRRMATSAICPDDYLRPLTDVPDETIIETIKEIA